MMLMCLEALQDFVCRECICIVYKSLLSSDDMRPSNDVQGIYVLPKVIESSRVQVLEAEGNGSDQSPMASRQYLLPNSTKRRYNPSTVASHKLHRKITRPQIIRKELYSDQAVKIKKPI